MSLKSALFLNQIAIEGIEGCCHRELDVICSQIQQLEAKNHDKVNLLLITDPILVPPLMANYGVTSTAR